MAENKRKAAKPGGVKAHAKLDTEPRRPASREPVREPKIDRNAPCPCGSGKKYKKCCARGETLWTRIRKFLGLGKKKGDAGEAGEPATARGKKRARRKSGEA
jgi:hypothetical protein